MLSPALCGSLKQLVFNITGELGEKNKAWNNEQKITKESPKYNE